MPPPTRKLRNYMNIVCPICSESLSFFTNGLLLNRLITIHYCSACNSFIKDINERAYTLYFNKSIYTDFNNEKETYKQRFSYLGHIFSLAQQHKKVIRNWLDFGCSYGHFIELLNSKGIISYGIEISDRAREMTNVKGLQVYRKLEDLPSMMFNAVSFIDSFYYTLEPKLLLSKVFQLLSDDGLLVIRIANRNWLMKFNKWVRHQNISTILPEHAILYSDKSITYLLQTSGFEILRVTSIEKGKRRSMKDSLLYATAVILYVVSFRYINLLPGIILIARKRACN